MYMKPDCKLDTYEELVSYALSINGYEYAIKYWKTDDPWEKFESIKSNGWQASFKDLRCCLFLLQRSIRNAECGAPAPEEKKQFLMVYKKICELWPKIDHSKKAK